MTWVAYTCRIHLQKDVVRCTGPQPIYHTAPNSGRRRPGVVAAVHATHDICDDRAGAAGAGRGTQYLLRHRPSSHQVPAPKAPGLHIVPSTQSRNTTLQCNAAYDTHTRSTCRRRRRRARNEHQLLSQALGVRMRVIVVHRHLRANGSVPKCRRRRRRAT